MVLSIGTKIDGRNALLQKKNVFIRSEDRLIGYTGSNQTTAK